MKNNKEKKYLNGTATFDELLEMVEFCGDFIFWYKDVRYNITIHHLPCITLASASGEEEWLANVKEYSTYKELLLNHKFSDGVSLLDWLASEDVYVE